MGFRVVPSKSVALFVPLPREEVERKILQNIENRESFFSPDPEKPFNGTFENHRFALGLNYYGNSRFNPFYNFSGTVGEADGGTRIELQFKTPVSTPLSALGGIAVGAAFAFSSSSFFAVAALAIGLACLSYAALIFNFNRKMNFAVDEIEFLFDYLAERM